MRLLGVLGFMLLAGLFFSVGVFCIGPRLRSVQPQPDSSQTAPLYAPRQDFERAAEADKPEENKPDLKLEVTEADGAEIPEADGTIDGSTPDVVVDPKTDGNSMTVTLEGRDKTDEARAEPKRPTTPSTADKPAKTGTASGVEKPRAAAEKRNVTYLVQAGSYANKSNADDLARKLRDEGYRRVTVNEVQAKDRTLYRVHVAEYKTREDADELAKDLKATGYTPAVIEIIR